MIRTAVVIPLALAATLVPSPVQADDRRCAGTIRALSIDGSVIVPEGATCRLLGTRVDGNVDVKSGATLIARGVRVGGNIQAENHQRVVVTPLTQDGVVRRSQVGGSIQLVQGGGGELTRNIVGSDVQLFSNNGLFEVRRNRIDGNLQCKSNVPRPTGGGNVVAGNKEDQCRLL